MRLLIWIFVIIGTKYTDARVKINREQRNLNYCHIDDNSHTFQIWKLMNNENDYVIEHEHDKNVSLRLQICEPLKKSCNGVEGFSICLNKNGKEIGIGKDPPKVITEFQEIIFKYTGDLCKNGQNYTASIKMICDYGIKNGHGIGLFAADPDDCDFNMQWKTKDACPSGVQKQLKCTVDDKFGQHYDLSALINYSDNYEVEINEKYSIILNVCHTILYRRNACMTSNAACLIEKDDNSGIKSRALGEPLEDLQYNSDRSLSLTYTNGMLCNYLNADINNVKTTITFFCDLNATETLPKYTGGMDNCHYQFIWYTASACSEQALRKKSERMNNDFCSVKDPITDQVYNLRELMNKDYIVQFFNVPKSEIKFAICGSLMNTTCKAGTGSCKIHNKTSGGIGNSKLLWKENGPYLNYSDGDHCYINQIRYTLIEFYCGSEYYEIEEKKDLCFDTIKFGTPLACSNKKKCATLENEVNLSQLLLEKYNYAIQMNNTKYHINVCRSLVPETDLNCPKGSAICKVTYKNGKETKTNLGSFYDRPTFIRDSSAVLIYKNGSTCEENKNKQVESSISFLCDINSELGYPRLKKYEDCVYSFEWKTSIVCGKVEGILKNHIINNSLGDVRDLSVLTKINGPVLTIKNAGGEQVYKISLFENKSACKGAFICDEKINYGTKVSVLYDYNINNVQFSFINGSKCGDDYAQATLIIKCKEENYLSSPRVKEEKSCYVKFEWWTSAICTSLKSSNDLAFIYVDKTTVFYNKGFIIGIVITLVLLILGCCLIKYTKRSHLADLFTKSSGRHGDRVKYSRVNTEEEVHLLLNTSDSAVVESDSDDDLLGD